MKEEIKQLQEKAREKWLYKSENQCSSLVLDEIVEQTFKQGYFVGREDLKQEIIADFDKKYREIFL
jgi:hypothetical protein